MARTNDGRISRERVLELLCYDPESGLFTWRVDRPNGSKAGSLAGWIDANGYRAIVVDGVTFKAARLAVLIVTGEWPTGDVDHRDRAPGDNRYGNLRPASRGQNNANTPRRARNKSGFKGVHKRLGWDKWVACIRSHGKVRTIGYFDTPEAAHAAYCNAAIELHGEFARFA